MSWIVFVAIAALLQFAWFGVLVGRARARYGVSAPAVQGHEIFERHYRVQYNTLEQLVMFLPALFLSAEYGFGLPWHGAAVGMVYVIGRQLYARAYVHEPKSRGLGFGLTVAPTALLLANAALGALYTELR